MSHVISVFTLPVMLLSPDPQADSRLHALSPFSVSLLTYVSSFQPENAYHAQIYTETNQITRLPQNESQFPMFSGRGLVSTCSIA